MRRRTYVSFWRRRLTLQICVVLPQLLMSLGSSIIFRLSDRGLPIVFSLGGVGAIVAAWLCWRMDRPRTT